MFNKARLFSVVTISNPCAFSQNVISTNLKSVPEPLCVVSDCGSGRIRQDGSSESMGTCVLCASSTYKTSHMTSRLRCPSVSSISSLGSTNSSDSWCGTGFTGPNGGSRCPKCDPVTFKEVIQDSPRLSCPANPGALAGSASRATCLCNAGITRPFGGDSCHPCAAGTYKS